MLIFKNGEYVEVDAEELPEEITPETLQSTDERLDEIKESINELKTLFKNFLSQF